MAKLKVSIIVPIYNVEKYLDRCLKSLINQTIKDIEIILVDDESPDRCPDICDEYAKYDKRIKVIHKKNGGLGFARNSGLEIATGQFVAFVDSDDYVDVTMFETLYDRAQEHDLDTVYCGFCKVDQALNEIHINEVNRDTIYETPGDVYSVLLDMIGSKPDYPEDRKFQMSVWHAIYSMKLITDNDIKFHSEREFISEDIVFHIDYLKHAKKIAFIPNSFYYYCANESSLSGSFRADRFERYKQLHTEISRRLIEIDGNDVNVDRPDRLFIGYSRSLIFTLFKYKISNAQRKSYIKEIVNDAVWGTIFKRYPYKQLPLKYKVIVMLLVNKSTGILFFISKLANK